MRRPLVMAAFGAAFVSIPAMAYVLGGHAVLHRFAEAQAFDHLVSSPLIGTGTVDNDPTPWPVRLDVAKSGCRASLRTPQGDASASLSGGRFSRQGAPAPALDAFVALGCPLIDMKDVPVDDADAAVTRFASEIGVDTGVSALSLVGGQVGYVVGAKPRQLQKPQIWIDKENDRALRVIAKHGGRLWDIVLLDASSIATNRQAPRIATVSADGHPELTLRLMAQTPRLSGREQPSETWEEEDEGE